MALRRARSYRAAFVAVALPAVLTTCDASLLGPTGVDRITLAFHGDTMLAVGRTLRPEIEVRHGEQVITAARLTLSSSDSAVIDITPAGELVLRRLGTATITAAL